jgi:hypothetical protein
MPFLLVRPMQQPLLLELLLYRWGGLLFPSALATLLKRINGCLVTEGIQIADTYVFLLRWRRVSAMLHLVLHDVLEAFGLYLQQPFLKLVRQGGWRELKCESGTREQRQASSLHQTGT